MMKRLSILTVLLAFFLSLPARATPMTLSEASRVGAVVSLLIQDKHYSQKALDGQIAKMHLQNYLNALDPTHTLFLQSDVNDFSAANAPTREVESGESPKKVRILSEASPAFAIFKVYLKRLDKVVSVMRDLAKGATDLNSKETYVIDRKKAPWPKNEAEQKQLLSKQFRFTLLSARVTGPKLEEEKKMIVKRYERMLTNMKAINEKSQSEILNFYLSALAEAFDPHSDYLGPENAEDFSFQMGQKELFGIGAILSEVDGYVTIMALNPGGPAAISKQFKTKDRILAVGQESGEPVDVVGMRLSDVVKMIRGPKSTKVTLVVDSGAAGDAGRRKVTVVRDTLRIEDQRASGRVIQLERNKRKYQVGVVTLPMFYEDCAEHVKRLLENFNQAKVEGVVLDLRNDGGGSLQEAIKLVGLFIPKGPVVQTRDMRGDKQTLADDDASVTYAGPLVVLQNEGSASASEITAAALQDLGRALIVGDSRTHGKGTVQTVYDLRNFLKGFDPGMLKVTTAKFYRINGSTTQRLGVKPDVVLHEAYEGGEASLEHSLQADPIAPLPVKASPIAAKKLEEIRKHAKERIAANLEFKYIDQDVARAKTTAKEPVVLSAAEFEARKKKLDAELALRTAERAKRTAPKYTEKVFAVDSKTGVVKPSELAATRLDRSKELATPEQKPFIEESEAHQKAELDESLAILVDWMGMGATPVPVAVTQQPPVTQ